jgi:polysaccharide pyruvyl transferase WcaK-like protein
MGYYGWSDDRQRGQATYARYIASISGFVAWLLTSGYGVRLLIGQRGADERAAADLREALRSHGCVDAGRLVCEPITSFDGLLAQAAETDLVIASRYHNIIGALLLGRPVISIGYSRKFDDLMRQMGLAAYCQNIEQLDVPKLIGQFKSLLADQSRLVAGIQEKCLEYRSRVEQGFDALWS